MSACDAEGAREWDLKKRKRKGESSMRLLENRGVMMTRAARGTRQHASHVTHMRPRRLRRGQPGADCAARGAGSYKTKWEQVEREGRGGRGVTAMGEVGLYAMMQEQPDWRARSEEEAGVQLWAGRRMRRRRE